MRVFKSTKENAPELFRLAKEHLDFMKMSYDEIYLKNSAEVFANETPDIACFLLEVDDIIVGYLIGIKCMHPFLGSFKVANEIGFYCNLKGNGHNLVKAYELWAQDCKCVSLVNQTRSINLDRYYQRLGYRAEEISYTKWKT